MISEITPLVKKAAREILLGGKTADVAKINGVRYPICRDYLHRYCKRINPEAYEELAIEAVNQGCSSPPKVSANITSVIANSNRSAYS